MKKRCKHEWKTKTVAGADWFCPKCGAYGSEKLVYNRKTGRHEYRIAKVNPFK